MYPKIVMELPGSVAWALAFFFMILLLGLDSEFNTVETVLTAFLDQWPQIRQSMPRKALFLAGLCSVLFLLGIPMVCNGGNDLFAIVDEYSSGIGAIFVAVFEILSIAWLYGAWNYHKDLRLMMGNSWPGCGRYYLTVFWCFISPAIVLVILSLFPFIHYLNILW